METVPLQTPPADWYWCLKHRRTESAPDRCPGADTMGPYGSAEEAGRWQEKVEERNDRWDDQDRRWEGDEDG